MGKGIAAADAARRKMKGLMAAAGPARAVIYLYRGRAGQSEPRQGRREEDEDDGRRRLAWFVGCIATDFSPQTNKKPPWFVFLAFRCISFSLSISFFKEK